MTPPHLPTTNQKKKKSAQGLTHSGLVTPYGNNIELIIIGSVNGLLPNGTKPLPELMFFN